MKFAAYAMPSYLEEFGLTQGEFLHATVDHLARAETLGFDAIWVNEHHFHPFGGMAPSVPVLLAGLAARTSRVRLGTSVLVLPLHHPIEVAEQLTLVDLLSRGRLEVGFGRGFAVHDYEVLGIPFDQSQDRLAEGLDVLLRLWSGEPVSHAGEAYHFSEVQLWPLPEQRPHPPVWIACTSSPTSFEWTATQGYNLLTLAYLRPIAALAALTQTYRDAWAAAGHTHDPGIATHYQVVVAEDRAEARRIAEGGMAEHARLSYSCRSLSASAPPPVNENLPIERLVDEGRLIAGTPDDCVQMLSRASAEIGCTEAHCLFQFGNIPFAVAQRSMDLFAAHVMPRMREALPVPAAGVKDPIVR